MKKILVATDLSARSDRALERAVELAETAGADLTVLHVVDDDLPAALVDAQRDAAEETIHGHLATLDAAKVGKISIEIVIGRAFHDILEIAEKTGAELIVLGVHRTDSFREFMDIFRGTTAERIIRASNIPVLSVKNRAAGPYKRLMVGIDFSAYSREAIRFAVRVAPTAEIFLVHAYHVPFQGFLFGDGTRHAVTKQLRLDFEDMIAAEMAATFADQEAKAPDLKRIIEQGEVRAVMRREAQRLNPDLLVIGTHGRTGVAHAFLGSVAEDMLNDPPCDVAAVKAW
jgi:nucleotide-binding universal stress UspA family protein